MKAWSRPTFLVIGFALLLAQAGISFWTPAQAQLGNSGVPVSCFALVLSNPALFNCTAADGTGFVNGRVPSGYYLHVTDIIILPSSTADTQSVVDSQDAGNTSIGSVVLQTSAYGSQGQHFTSPALVLPAAYRLHAYSLNGPGFSAEVYGLLTRNVTYVPLIAR